MFSSQNSQVSNAANYIEDVFSTWLNTGNDATATITNGIDLSGKGGLVWFKSRSGGSTGGTYSHYLWDTARGTTNVLLTNDTRAQITGFTDGVTSFNSNGFSIGPSGACNESSTNYASWTFRKQPKFFDVVTWTGNGSFPRTISHSLGSQPGCIIAKKTSAAEDWYVSHRATPNPYIDNLFLNTTAAVSSGAGTFDNVTSTSFETYMNASGATYVAYLFAHNAGGFGLTGTDNVISCGTYSGANPSTVNVNLGFEPQWLLVKPIQAGPWYVIDNMRGMPVAYGAGGKNLKPNYSDEEATAEMPRPYAQGFYVDSDSNILNNSSQTYIYIAIRKGPMKVPTDATKVFSPNTTTTNNTVTTNFPVDLSLFRTDKTSAVNNQDFDRLRGQTQRLSTNLTNAEATATAYPLLDNNTGFGLTGFTSGLAGVAWNFQRAPSFFDVVCYTGTGTSTRYITHGLSATPELAIVKKRSSSGNWVTTCLTTGGTSRFMCLNTSNPSDVNVSGANGFINLASSSAYDFLVRDNGGNIADVNASSATYVAYLFATCAGVSKVFAYTGNGSSRTINCGFTSGARFVMIKRVDSAGDWYVWDSARGIVAGNDPHLSLNDTAAEVTTDDSVDTDSTGFTVNQVAATNINVNYADYIGLAIA